MVAIETKYLGATDTKGSRIKASANGHSVTVGYDHAKNQGAEVHSVAALALCRKLGWTAHEYLGAATHLIAGGTDNGYVFVFAKLELPRPAGEYDVFELPAE